MSSSSLSKSSGPLISSCLVSCVTSADGDAEAEGSVPCAIADASNSVPLMASELDASSIAGTEPSASTAMSAVDAVTRFVRVLDSGL